MWDTFLWENLHIEPKPNCMLNVAHLADCDVNIRAMSTTHLFIIIKLLNALVFKCFGWWRAWWKLFNTRIGRNKFYFYVFTINRFNSVLLNFIFQWILKQYCLTWFFLHFNIIILTYTCLLFSILEINECATHPCQHGTCTDGFNKYICVCEPSFAGVNCETSINFHS